ncbi:hypothetical protein Tco_0345688 [Tanacetum coccineum]
MIIENIQVCHQGSSEQDSRTQKQQGRTTRLDLCHLQLSRIQPLDAAIRQLVVDSVAAALEARVATMANTDNPNRNIEPRETPELAVLCPNMVPNSEKLMEVFIGGLPRSIEGNVTALKPQTLEEAITITQRLMEQGHQGAYLLRDKIALFALGFLPYKQLSRILRPGLSKSVDSDILFDIAGRTLLLGRAEFCLVTGFACGKVVFPKYLDDDIPPFVRRLFLENLKKLEKNKAGLGEAAKGKVAQPSDKGDKDSVTNEDLGELVQDKAEKGEAAQPSVTIKDLGELVQKDVKWKKLSADDFVWILESFPNSYHWWSKKSEVIPRCLAWSKKTNFEKRNYPELFRPDLNPTTKLQPTDAEMGQNWYRRSYNYLDVKEKSVPLDDLGGVSQDDEFDAYTRQDGRGATVGAKVSGEVMNDANMSVVVHVEEKKSAREIVLENKVEFLEAKVDKLQLDHDQMANFL